MRQVAMHNTKLHQPPTTLLVLALLALTATPGSPAADAPAGPLFPFVLPWDDDTPGVTDLSGWLHKPAGKAGHIRVGPDGHFYAGPDRIRFFGVNMSFGANVPTKADAEKVAARLSKFGINIVRFHHADTSPYPDGLRARGAAGTGQLHPEALDRFHYFLARLRDRGSYANINLLVGRPFNASDGLPAEIEALGWKQRHVVGFFWPKQQELQKDYARRLLTTPNPYTGLAPAQDPAVAFVEVNNENGLVHAWLGQELDQMPGVFRAELQRQWNQWLRSRYKTTAQLREAWSQGAQPLGVELLVNADFAQGMQRWTVERHAGAQANATVVDELPPALRQPGTSAKALRLEVAQPGIETWHVQLNQAGLKLQQGTHYTVQFWAKADPGRVIAVSVGQAHEPWANLGLSVNPRLTNTWRQFRYVFTATQTDDRARISFSSLGGPGSVVMLAGISIRPGGVEGLQADESVEAGTVPAFERAAFGQRTGAAQRDWIRFLMETEDRYWQSMYRFLKDELQVKALVTGTIGGCAPLNLMAKMDWVDTHAYWQHPRFPRRPWDPEDWIVENRTMVNEAGGTLPRLAGYRVAGKPHACTEYNHPAPNTYNSEAFLLLAVYAALQDWDAIYAYCYAHSRAAGWDSRRINGFFDIDQHPTKMVTLVPAAAMFVRGDVLPARSTVAASLPLEREIDLLRSARSWGLVGAADLGIQPAAALVHRVALATEGVDWPPGALAPSAVQLTARRFVSDTGQLIWDITEPGRGVVTVNTPRTKAVIGFGGGKRFALGDVIIEPGQSLQEGWSAITLTAMNTTTPESARWLITATGLAENTGQQWKSPAKNSVGRNWGAAPSRVEGIPARIKLPQPASAVQAWALDERGQRRTKLPVQADTDGRAVLELGPQWQTLWYEAVAQ